MSTFRLPVEQVGLEQSIQRAMRKFQNSPLKLNINDKNFTQPLGRITASADEFTKSIEASNARVVAFGASVAVINSIQNAFKQLVVQTIQVQKSLTEINVVMNQTSSNLDRFGNSLFDIAKNTAQSFDTVATAATEFARQGLSMEKTLKRTNDALVLTRLTGMKAADAVKGLTAAVNSFADAGLTTAEVMNKLAAVDMAFAVSSDDLINGLSRAAAVAQDAGMNIDQLIGSITAAQQITARGGAVIGNSFKTIFTRIQRPETLKQLEKLGIAIRDTEKNVLPAVMIVENLAKAYDGLSQSQQANTTQLVGGMFQINVLKAAMRDLAKENSITARATKISSSATDEAIKKNEQLNKTLAALSAQTVVSLQKLASQVGEITVGPGIEKILKAVNGLAEGISGILDGEGIASEFANGFLKGLGNIISGPGAVLILGIVGKLFVDVGKFATTSLKNFMGMTSEAQKQKAVQESILNVLRTNSDVASQLIGKGVSKRKQEKIILDLIVQQTAAQREQLKIASRLAKVAVRAGADATLVVPSTRRRAGGHIPNFSKDQERAGALAGGYSPGAVKTMQMPGQGEVMYNTAERVKKMQGFQQPFINPPLSSKAGKNHRQTALEQYGIDPYASRGYIPNFSKLSPNKAVSKYETNKDFENAVADGNVRMDQRFTDKLTPAQLMAFNKGKARLQANKDDTERRRSANAEMELAKRININASDSKAGGPFASLIPTINYAPQLAGGAKGVSSTFKIGAKSFPFMMKNLMAAGPRVPHVEGVSGYEEDMLEEKVSSELFSASAKYANVISPKNSPRIDKRHIQAQFESGQGGAAGALQAAVGAGFESAVAKAYGIDSAKSQTSGGDFDLHPGNVKDSGTLDAVNNLFFGSSGPYKKLDFKSSLSIGNLSSMAKKIYKEQPQKYISDRDRRMLKVRQKYSDVLPQAAAASGGYIPNYAQDDPLIDAIQREKNAGLPISKIRVNQSNKLKNNQNPAGLAVTNTRDEPRGLRDVPNFAAYTGPNAILAGTVSGRKKGGALKGRGDQYDQLESSVKKIIDRINKFSRNNERQQKRSAVNAISNESKKGRLTQAQTKEAFKQLGFNKKQTKEAMRQVDLARKRGGMGAMNPNTGIGAGARMNTMLEGQGGMMAMIGLPMIGGAIDQIASSITGNKSRYDMSAGERFSQNFGGRAATNIATGGMMGGMVGGMALKGTMLGMKGGPLGMIVGAVAGLGVAAAQSASDMELSLEDLSQASQEASASINNMNQILDGFVNLTGKETKEQQKEKIVAAGKDTAGKSISKKGNEALFQKLGVQGNSLSFVDALKKVNQGSPDDRISSLNDLRGAFTNKEEAGLNRINLQSTLTKRMEEVDALDSWKLAGGTQEKVSGGLQEELMNELGGSLSQEQLKTLGDYARSDKMKDFDGSLGDGFSNETVSMDIAKMMGFEDGSQAFEDASDAMEDIFDEGGAKQFMAALEGAAGAFEELDDTAKDTIKILRDRRAEFAKQARANRLLTQSMELTANEMKGDNKIADMSRALSQSYDSLSDTVKQRIQREKENAKLSLENSTHLKKVSALNSARASVLNGLLPKLQEQAAEQIDPKDIKKLREEIENADEERLMQILQDNKILSDITSVDEDILQDGTDVADAKEQIVEALKHQNKLINSDNRIQDEIISLDEARKQATAELNESIRSVNSKINSRMNELDLGFALGKGGSLETQAANKRDEMDKRFNIQGGRVLNPGQNPFQEQMRVANIDQRIAERNNKLKSKQTLVDFEKQMLNALRDKTWQVTMQTNTSALQSLTSAILQEQSKEEIGALNKLGNLPSTNALNTAESLLRDQLSLARINSSTSQTALNNQRTGGIQGGQSGYENLDSGGTHSSFSGQTMIYSDQTPEQLEAEIAKYAKLATEINNELKEVVRQKDERVSLEKKLAPEGSISPKLKALGVTSLPTGRSLNGLPNHTPTGMNKPSYAAGNYSFQSAAPTGNIAQNQSEFVKTFSEVPENLIQGLRSLGALQTTGKLSREDMSSSITDRIKSGKSANINIPKGGALDAMDQMVKRFETAVVAGNDFQNYRSANSASGKSEKDLLADFLQTQAQGQVKVKEFADALTSATISVAENSQEADLLDEEFKNLKDSIARANDPLVQLAKGFEALDFQIANAEAKGNFSEAAQLRMQKQNQFDKLGPSAKMKVGGMTGYQSMSAGENFMQGMQSIEIPTENQFFQKLGHDLPRTFADNMATALTEGLAGIKSWDDALHEVAMGFLNTLQQALNQRIADQMLGFMNQGLNSLFGGFSKGGVVRRNSGGLVEGGSGTKDDVPAMLNSGEYVIRKAAVNKYGTEFLGSLNQGTTQKRNTGGFIASGIDGRVDIQREELGRIPSHGKVAQNPSTLPEQTGEGGYLLPSSGEAGRFIAGEIKGRENLLTFANQGATSGANDIISSSGAIDEFGQTMYQGQGLNMQLEDESMRLSGVGLRQSPVADEVLQAKQQALDAVAAYDSNVKAQADYRTAKRKAIQGAIKGALISAAVSAGMSQLSGAMQASGTAKSANTINVADAGGLDAYNAANPNNTLTSGDLYMKGGAPNVGKATSKLNSYGIQAGQERSYVQQTQSGLGTDNFTTTRGSTSTFSNFFSRGASTANAAGGALANIGMQASPMGVVSQKQTFWGGNVKSPQSFTSVRGPSNSMRSIMSSQSTSWTSDLGNSYSGFQSVNQAQNTTWDAKAFGNASNRGANTRNLARQVGTQRRAAGGRISSSKVPALLTGGEYVVNKDAVKKHGLSFMNSVNSQSLNKGGKVKGASMGASPLEDQSTILQQILETLLEQGAQEEARAEQIQNLTEKSESTVNNNTTQEIKTKGESQIKVLTSILEAIKEQNTELPAQISNTLQNSNIINNSTTNNSANSSQSSNSSNSTINSTSNSSTSNSFVDNTTIQNNLLGEILETLKFPSAGPAPATSTSAGGGASGSNVNITVNVDSKGGEMGGGAEMTNSSSSGVNSVTKDKAAELASQIKSAVIEIITEQQRLGGILRKKP